MSPLIWFYLGRCRGLHCFKTKTLLLHFQVSRVKTIPVSPLLWMPIFARVGLPFRGPCYYHTWCKHKVSQKNKPSGMVPWLTGCLLPSIRQADRQATEPQLMCVLCPGRLACLLPDTHGGWATWLMPAPASEVPTDGLWRVALSSILVKTYFKCFFLVLLLFFILPIPTTLGSVEQGKETDNQTKGETNKHDSVALCGRGQDAIRRHCRTSALCKTRNALTTAGQHPTLNTTFAVAKRLRNQKGEHRDHTMRAYLV